MITAFYIDALLPLLAIAILFWLISTWKEDVSIVDSIWSIFIIAAATYVFLNADNTTTRSMLVLTLVFIWGLRLSVYITIRHWKKEEDHRYKLIRERNQPGFKYKSLYLVFIFQAVVAWTISMPIMHAIDSSLNINFLDWAAIILWITGMYYEVVADYQMYKFKQNPDNKGKILTTGLWAQTRHPNYFGEFLITWGFFLFAAASGAYITIFAPLVMSIFLLKFSGVQLLESTMKNRDGYGNYMETTNAFIPDITNTGKNR